MRYHELLSHYIEQSGSSLGELSLRLRNNGIEISKSYLSKLKNGSKPPASEELNAALAEITGGDPEKLNWYAYIEKAPEGFKKVLYQLGEEVIPVGKRLLEEYPGIFEGNYSPEDMREIENSEVFNDFMQKYRGSVLSTMFMGLRDNDPIEWDIDDDHDEDDQETIIEISLYEAYLRDAKKTLVTRLNKTNDQVLIRSAILQAFTALEIRLNEVLHKAIEAEGDSEKYGLNYLDEFPINGKLLRLLEKHLQYDITKEPFYSQLWSGIAIRNRILHEAVQEVITKGRAKEVISTIESAIESINKHALAQGIE